MVSGLRFIWLEVTDLERSISFYRDGLGLRVEAVAPVQGRPLASVDAGELELILAQFGPAETSRGAGVRLYLVSRDVAHYAAALRSRGVAVSDPTEEPWGGQVSE